MSNVLINIASEFDSKGFKKAQSSTSALEKQVNKLGKALLGAFSAQKILAYSKASVNAYAQDQKSAALLSNQLKNLGLAYSAVDVEKFIASLEAQTGILDDELRPAFSQLVRVTGTLAESQKLMTLAFDVSRGAGIDYMQAVDAISKAYVGNLKGLKKLNLGLTDAQLKTMKFSDIIKVLNDQFGGAGSASLNTYAGKIDRLNVALANAQETIGKGFVDAFAALAKDDNFNTVINSISNMALYIADAVRGIGTLMDDLDRKTPSWLKKLFGSETLQRILIGPLKMIGDYLSGQGSKSRVSQSMPQGAALFLEEQRGKAAAKTLAVNKKITDQTKKQTAEKKAQLAIDKAQQTIGTAKNIFDLERVSVAAAMANTTLTDNELKRLEIKQAIFGLEDAIASKDTARVEAATKTLNGLLGQFEILQAQNGLLADVKKAYDALGMNKDLINLNNLALAIAKLQEMNLLLNGTKTPSQSNNIYSPTLSADIYAKTAGLTFGSVGAKPFTQGMSLAGAGQWIGDEYAKLNAAAAAIAPGQLGINLIVTDNAKNLVDIVMETVTEASASGTPPIVSRIGSNLAW